MKKKVKKNKNRGITLVALVITIIVLLIMAGVALSISIGDNGYLEKTKQAGEETNKQTATEKMKLKITNIQMASFENTQRMPTLQEVADYLCEDNEIAYVNLEKQKIAAINDKITVGENTAIYTKLEEYPYEFEINNEIEIASTDAIKIADTTGTENKGETGEIPEGYIQPSGTKLITENGEHDVKEYEKAEVNVPIPEGYIQPSGTKSITENGESNVKEYEKVNVNVPTYAKDSTLKITTKGNKIDVSNYQYADTTALYTKDQIQTGENFYWHKTSTTFPSDGSVTMDIDLGYIPSFIYINTVSRGGTKMMWYSDDDCKTFSWYNFQSSVFHVNTTDSAWSLVNGKLRFKVGEASDWAGVKINIFAIK